MTCALILAQDMAHSLTGPSLEANGHAVRLQQHTQHFLHSGPFGQSEHALFPRSQEMRLLSANAV